MNRRMMGLLAATSVIVAAGSMSSIPAQSESPLDVKWNRQPKGHRSSTGSTSNNFTKAEKKRKRKMARKSRKRS